MKVKEIGLSWIVVKNFKEAVKYYTDVVGLYRKRLKNRFLSEFKAPNFQKKKEDCIDEYYPLSFFGNLAAFNLA